MQGALDERHGAATPDTRGRRRYSASRRVLVYLVTLLLVSCALMPDKRKVAREVEVPQAAQQLARAEVELQKGNLEEASQAYRKLAMAFPQSPEAAKALVRQGEIDFRLEHFGEAAYWFEQVLNRYPLSSEADAARLWLLRCYVRLERFPDALETGRSLLTYLSERAQQAEVAEIVGDVQISQGDYSDAVRWYVKANTLAGEDNRLAQKVDGALAHLDGEQVQILLDEYPVGFPNLRLQTRMVKLDMTTGLLALAQQRVEALIEKQPLHPLADEWIRLRKEIEEWLKVDMNSVGCLLPLSGRYQAYGDRVFRGLIMAAEEVDLSTGFKQDIRLVIKDTKSDPEVARKAVRDLVSNHRVAAIIGPLSRLAAEAAAREAQGLGVPIITFTQKRGVSELGDYVFRDFISNEQQTRSLAEYAVLGMGYRRFAFLYPNDGYGKTLMNLFWDELDRLGAEIRGVESYDTSQTDFANEVKKLVGMYYPRPKSERIDEARRDREAGFARDERGARSSYPLEEEPLPIVDFDAIYIPDSYEKVGLIAPQLVYHDVTGITLLGTNLWNSAKLLEMAGPYLEGAVFVDGFFPDSTLPYTRRFVQGFQESFDATPGYLEAQAYDTLRLLMEALRKPGVVSRPLLRNALLGIEALPGAAGTASMSSTGEVTRNPFLITIKRRRMAEVQLDFDTLHSGESPWEVFTGEQKFHQVQEPSTMPESLGSGADQQSDLQPSAKP